MLAYVSSQVVDNENQTATLMEEWEKHMQNFIPEMLVRPFPSEAYVVQLGSRSRSSPSMLSQGRVYRSMGTAFASGDILTRREVR